MRIVCLGRVSGIIPIVYSKTLADTKSCLLYYSFMVAMFNRPSIISSGSVIPLPDARLDKFPRVAAGIPAPIVERILQTRLANQLSSCVYPDIPSQVKSVEIWMASLPSVFRMYEPDTQWDKEHPRLVF